MGTTIATVHFAETSVYVGHVGDSRVYRFRDGTLELVTEDHSLLNDYLKAKKLSPEEIEAFPHKNVIVRALGMKDTVQVDVGRFEPKDGDVFLLCSDGLSGMVTDAEMERAAARARRISSRPAPGSSSGPTPPAATTTSPASWPAAGWSEASAEGVSHRLQRVVVVHPDLPESWALGGAAAGDEMRPTVPGAMPVAVMGVTVEENHRSVPQGAEQRVGVEEA